MNAIINEIKGRRRMAEGEDEVLVSRLVSELCRAIEAATEPVA